MGCLYRKGDVRNEQPAEHSQGESDRTSQQKASDCGNPNLDNKIGICF